MVIQRDFKGSNQFIVINVVFNNIIIFQHHFVLIINVQYLVSVALNLVINLIFLYNFPVTKCFKSIKYKEF